MTRQLAILVALTGGIASAQGAEIHVYSGGAPQAALRVLGPQFEKASQHKINFTFALVTTLQKRLLAGEKADVIFLPVPLIAATEKARPMRAEGRTVLARVGLGVVIREGVAKPDISNADAVRKLLVNAKSIAFAEPNTPGGGYVLKMFSQLGISDDVKSRIIHRAAIDGGADLIAKGEADIGLYLLSEMQTAKGISIVGLLPPGLAFNVIYGTAIPTSNDDPGPALQFVKFLTSFDQAEHWKRAGFEPGPPSPK